MPANLQVDSSSKGIEQRHGMPANVLQLFWCVCIFWTLEATLGTTLGPLFALFSTIWARLRPLWAVFYGLGAHVSHKGPPTSKWWGLADLIWSPIWVISYKIACFCWSVFWTWFFYYFWVTAKVVRRVFVREGACFSFSHQSKKNVKRAPFWDPGWKHLSLKVVYGTVPKDKDENTWY